MRTISLFVGHPALFDSLSLGANVLALDTEDRHSSNIAS